MSGETGVSDHIGGGRGEFSTPSLPLTTFSFHQKTNGENLTLFLSKSALFTGVLFTEKLALAAKRKVKILASLLRSHELRGKHERFFTGLEHVSSQNNKMTYALKNIFTNSLRISDNVF